MADQNVYAFKVKVEFTQQAAIEAERQRGWSPKENAQNPIQAVTIGQLGWVRSQSYDNGTWSSVQLLAAQGFCWIPRHCIDVGAVKGVGNALHISVLESPTVIYNAPNTLVRVLGTFFQEMLRHKETVCEAGAYQKDVETLCQDRKFMDLILKGMENASTRPLFNNGHPTWEQLWSLPAITPKDNMGGIYAILYWARKDDNTRENYIYVGKSVDIANRFAVHHAVITGSSQINSSRNHYEAARLALRSGGSFRGVKIAQWNIDALPATTNGENLLKYAEHTFVSLCYSWNPKLLKTTSNVEAFSKNGGSWKAAQFFGPFSQRIFKTAGWNPPGFTGLNWTTPLTENRHNERILWTGTFLPPSPQFEPGKTMMKIFRRPAMKIGKTAISRKGSQSLTLRILKREPATKQTKLNFTIQKKIAQSDDYNQRIETSPAKPWNIDPVRLLSKFEVSQLLDARYRVRNNDGSETRLAMGVKPQGIFEGPGMGTGLARKTCDLCFIANLHDQDIFAPPTSNYAKAPFCTSGDTGADTCVRCSRLNRPCTWTSRTNMINRGWTNLGVSKLLVLQPRSIPRPDSSREMLELENDNWDEDDDGDRNEGEDDDDSDEDERDDDEDA